jgi:hypothetical protein
MESTTHMIAALRSGQKSIKSYEDEEKDPPGGAEPGYIAELRARALSRVRCNLGEEEGEEIGEA